jgi:HlyD family secretion protein
LTVCRRGLSSGPIAAAKETMTFRERTWTEARAQTEKDLGVARTRLKRARADLESARVSLARAERDVERCRILSPLKGVVTARGVNQGDQVMRATGDTTHYIVSDLSRLLVYADVDEGDVTQCTEGQPARVRVGALGDEVRLRGHVYDVGLRAEKRPGAEVPSVRVRILIDKTEPLIARLRPGMTASVEVETARRADALKVPLQAIVQREVRILPEAVRAATNPALLAGKQPHDVVDVVFVVDVDKVRAVVVRRGLQDEDEAEVLDATLAADAQLIVGPFRALKELEHDERVRPGPAEVTLPPDVAEVASVGSTS